MSIEMQNWVVYGILGVVMYLLMGSTLKKLLFKVILKDKTLNRDSIKLKIYSESCRKCDR